MIRTMAVLTTAALATLTLIAAANLWLALTTDYGQLED